MAVLKTNSAIIKFIQPIWPYIVKKKFHVMYNVLK